MWVAAQHKRGKERRHIMADMTMEQFEEFAKTLPEGANKRGVAKQLGLVLPMHMQLEEVSYDGTEGTISIPSLMLEDGNKVGRRTIDARVARQTAERILAVCDENNL